MQCRPTPSELRQFLVTEAHIIPFSSTMPVPVSGLPCNSVTAVNLFGTIVTLSPLDKGKRTGSVSL